MIDLSNLKAPGWQRIVSELSAPAPDEAAFIVRLFSSTMIDDIAGGKACVAIGWSGDINIAAGRAKENKSKDVIEALLPSTGALIFADTMAVTKDAKHPNNAAAFIDFYLRAENAARMSNEMNYPTGNKAAMEKIADGSHLQANITVIVMTTGDQQ